MARTWTLSDTLSNAVDTQISSGNNVAFENYGNLYFGFNGEVYSWNNSFGFSQISSGLSTTALTIFNDSLYALVYSGSYPSYTPNIYKYSTGTTWNLVYTGSTIGYTQGNLIADDNRIVAVLRTGGNLSVIGSVDGSSWATQTANSGNFSGSFFSGVYTNLPNKSDYSGEKIYIFDGDVWEHSSGSDWSKVNLSSLDASIERLVGVIDERSWFGINSNSPLSYSDDYGVNISASSGNNVSRTDFAFVQRFSLYTFLVESMSNDAVVWNLNGTTWENDGTPDSRTCLLFVQNGFLYALTQSINGGGSYTDINIYYGNEQVIIGTNNTGEFFFGIEAITKKSDLSFSVNPKGLAVNTQTDDAVLVANVQQAQMASKMLKSEDFSVENDFTDGLDTDTDTAYNTVEYI